MRGFIIVLILGLFGPISYNVAHAQKYTSQCPNVEEVGKRLHPLFLKFQYDCTFSNSDACDRAEARLFEEHKKIQSECYFTIFEFAVIPIPTPNDKQLTYRYEGSVGFSTCKYETETSVYLCQFYAKQNLWRCAKRVNTEDDIPQAEGRVCVFKSAPTG